MNAPAADPYRAAPRAQYSAVIADPKTPMRMGAFWVLCLLAVGFLLAYTYAGRGVSMRCSRPEGQCVVREDYTAFVVHHRVPLDSIRTMNVIRGDESAAPSYSLVLVADDTTLAVTRPDARGESELGALRERFEAFRAGTDAEFSIDRSREPDPTSVLVGPLFAAVLLVIAALALHLRDVRVSAATRSLSLWERRPGTLLRSRMIREWPLDQITGVSVELSDAVGRKRRAWVMLDKVGGKREPLWIRLTPERAAWAVAGLRHELHKASRATPG